MGLRKQVEKTAALNLTTTFDERQVVYKLRLTFKRCLYLTNKKVPLAVEKRFEQNDILSLLNEMRIGRSGFRKPPSLLTWQLRTLVTAVTRSAVCTVQRTDTDIVCQHGGSEGALPAHPSASTAATLRVVECPGHLALDSEAHWLRSEGSVVGMKVFEGSS